MPYDVTLRHHHTFGEGIPTSINISEGLFLQLRKALSIAQSVIFLTNILPGNVETQTKRRQEIDRLLSDISTKRLECPGNIDALKGALLQLSQMQEGLSRRLERYQLVMRARNVTYEALKKYV